MAGFLVFRQFNRGDSHLTGMTGRIDPRIMKWLDGATMPGKIVQSLAQRRAVVVKEVFESFEFFERVRHQVRRPAIIDLCCGHGLTGLLFGALERQVEEVHLLDKRQSDNQKVVLEAVIEAAPWVEEKVHWHYRNLNDAAPLIHSEMGVLGVHACGGRTDTVLELAVSAQAPVAVLPCCYSSQACRAPQALLDALGPAQACDIDRTYRLEAANYRVQWTSIPEVITPMNRILRALPPR